MGSGIYPERKTRLFNWFGKKGVELIGGVRLEKVTREGLDIATRNGSRRFLRADGIIPATPLAVNLDLMDGLKGKVAEIYAVGDCTDPGVIPDAIAAGWEVGNKI
jgi:2,4-dienoyl-CoA reductase (NADPH2)